jgi:hypothetical protein
MNNKLFKSIALCIASAGITIISIIALAAWAFFTIPARVVIVTGYLPFVCVTTDSIPECLMLSPSEIGAMFLTPTTPPSPLPAWGNF